MDRRVAILSIMSPRPTIAGRVAFIVQWIAPVVLPFFLFWGRVFVGAPLGWLAVVGVVYAAVMLVALYIAPILTIYDRDVRPIASTRNSYATVSWMLWVAVIVMALSVPDQADSPPFPAALTVWTDGGVSAEMASFIFTLASVFALIMWIATIALAIVGIVRSRRPVGMPAPRVGGAASAG